jgi:dimethylamine monooxygenase subunit A
MLRETAELARAAGLRPNSDPSNDLLMELGTAWEFDFLLLQAATAGPPLLVGGVVCFPSSWSLEEKIGRPLNEIHDPVPGLNAQVGTQINTFLNRLAPGIAWERANWGLSASPELNQHPHRSLPRLGKDANWESTWMRIEHQALIALPRSAGLLFTIRIQTFPLASLRENPSVAPRFVEALKTMPAEVARYKNLHEARESLLVGF